MPDQPPAPPPSVPSSAPATSPAQPVAKAERIDALDVLRGFALLGILLVNIELFRGPDFYGVSLGELPERVGSDRVVDALVGWLVSGKFLSSFAMLFGVGAAIIAGRVQARGRSPRPVLARRYVWLIVFGLAHMVLLFPGDILFHYGITGLVLLAFVGVRARTAVAWSMGLLGAFAAIAVTISALAVAMPETSGRGADDPFTASFESFVEERREAAVEAYTSGGPSEQIRARAWESVLVQTGQMFFLPWTLALFLFGFAVWRSGVLTDPERRRQGFRRAAMVALPVGLVINLPLGATGALGGGLLGSEGGIGGVAVLAAVAQTVGAPVLAVGYLAAIGLLAERPGVLAVLAPLRDAGRMALTSYLLQSLLAALFFTGFRFYGRLSLTEALPVVVGIWAAMLLVASLVMRRFERGPVEHVWRLGTYGHLRR